MDLGNPWVLFSGLIIGAVGFVLFVYGKKQANYKCLFTGLVLCIFPYFVSSLLAMWLITAGCLGGLYAMTRND
jgi:hypothetical protein